ncbi:MAG: ATP-binding cassette domain-containing protein [Gammaproteobacteria bacterium]|nr:ATP-binding cassette domain-containing protein [Gammaproteobacteria bacterium]MBQ0840060.1 ATP-binding cassette domain-containing protein [Gammaproteobacteria bacterium]
MITAQNLELIRGNKSLLKDANMRVHDGQKIGLIGANGSGKSSLFGLLKGELHADAGDIGFPVHWRISSVDQETPSIVSAVLDYTIDGDSEYRDLEAEKADAEVAGGDVLANWHHRYEALNGYSMVSRAAQLLAGLGFDHQAQQQPVSSFSGGWRMRVNLARALLKPSELLLLDEPTNHLDLEAVVWLERWLKRYAGTLIVISHDRDFLDNLVDGIIHFNGASLDTYAGNYSSFERQRGERLMLQQAVFDKQQRQRAHLQAFVDRFRYQATKARQAQSRVKALEKLQAAAPIHAASGFDFEFFEPDELCSPLVSFDQVQAGYGDTVILKHIHLNLLPGSRIGLLGRNGAGKSTLVKLLAGVIQPLCGDVDRGRQLQVGYFDQQQLDALDLEASPLLHLQRIAEGVKEQELRNYLGTFGFRGDAVLAPVGPLSGGEKTRLALALLVWQRPNLLLLDEPTNHLDIDMREALILALQEFPGAVVVVSHDRHLLHTVVDELYLVANGEVRPFDGDLDDYQRLQIKSTARPQDSDTEETAAGDSSRAPDRQEQKRMQAEFRRQAGPQRKKISAIEKKMAKLELALESLAEQLADPALYTDKPVQELNKLMKAQGEGKNELQTLEEDWLLITEELEEMTVEFERQFVG